jgi:hypothetical protein
MANVTKNNLDRLKELSDELCGLPKDEYKVVVKKLKTIVEDGKKDIEHASTSQNKIKCYETMCASITTLLASINL